MRFEGPPGQFGVGGGGGGGGSSKVPINGAVTEAVNVGHGSVVISYQ